MICRISNNMFTSCPCLIILLFIYSSLEAEIMNRYYAVVFQSYTVEYVFHLVVKVGNSYSKAERGSPSYFSRPTCTASISFQNDEVIL